MSSNFGNRKRKAPLKTMEPYRREGTQDDPGADFARNTEADPFRAAFLSGRHVTVQFAGQQSVSFAHGLGRPCIGGFVTWVSDTRYHVQLFSPQAFDRLGGDVTTYASVGYIASGSLGPWSGTCGVYVF